jgi:hypothetical protein
MIGSARVEWYRLHVARCLSVAQNTTDSEAKIALLDMARAWLLLAEQNEKNDHTEMPVYEVLEPWQHVVQQQQQPHPEK